MDGNRRWARKRGLDEVEGHRQGVKAIKPLVKRAIDLGIKVVTFWAFATKNFDRDKSFLRDIMSVFRETLERKSWFEEIKDYGGRLNIIGNPRRFPKDILTNLNRYLRESQPVEEKAVVNFGLEYEGRDEIVRGIKRVFEQIQNSHQKDGQTGFRVQDLTVNNFGQFLDTAGQPDPDLMIRTSGEYRTSGYLIWQAADAELYFTETLWPDFTVEEFNKILEEYGRRERRFGK
jgi:undecaprenyl diphosphate synthase